MDNKKIVVVIVLGLFVVGGFSMLFFGNKGNAPTNNDQQQGESYDEMMEV